MWVGGGLDIQPIMCRWRSEEKQLKSCSGGGCRKAIETWKSKKGRREKMFFVVDKLVCLRSHETCTICGPRISERELQQFVAQ